MLKRFINSLSLIFETANQERKLIFKDDAAVEIYIFFVALVYFFYSFVYSPEIFTKLPIAYVDNDQTTVSHQIKRMLNDTESMSIAYDALSMEEAKKLFEEGKVNGIVVIPEKFSEKLQKSGGNPSIAIYCDASYMLYYDKTLQAVTNALGAFTGELQLKQTMMSGTPMKEAVASSKPFNIIANPLYNLEEGYGIFIIPMVLIVALQTLQLTGMGVLSGTMREKNTFITNFAMARRSRFGYFFMTIGRSIPYLMISMLLLLLGILVVFHIFTIPQRGSLVDVIAFLVPVVLAITFLGMSLMNIFRNREDTILLLTVFSIPALMMGGVSYPVVAFPLWIKVMAFFFPSTIGVKGFLSLSQAGASLFEIRDIYMEMWGICLFYFIIAVWTNRRFLLYPEVSKSLQQESPIITAIEEVQNFTKETIFNLLKPLKNLVWNFNTAVDTFQINLSEKIKNIPKERLQEPPLFIAGPILDRVKYYKNNEHLKNLYANLMANAMDKDSAHLVLPSYVQLVNNLSPDEAKLLMLFLDRETIPFVNIVQKSNKDDKAYTIVLENYICLLKEYNLEVENTENLPLYFSNFVRMGIIYSPEGYSLESYRYKYLDNCEDIIDLKAKIEQSGLIYDTERRFYRVTVFGKHFINVALKSR